MISEKTVLVIFKTHLDVGFTDLAKNVLKRYFNDFVVNAVKTADWYREQNNGRSYVWTVGSWLIYEYLERATPRKRKFLEQAILRGDIVWHGLPFTTHSELADAELFSYGVSLSAELDRRFGLTTVAAKMTDVPGHTRGIIAPLAKAGIKFLHIGVNPVSAVPDVPPLFRWVDARSNSIVVMYQADYGATGTIPDSNLIFHLAVTGDNLGPHTPEQAETVFNYLQQQYPDHRINAGTLNEVAAEILAIEPTLPTVYDEIGDSWIHGIGSDPLKVSLFKRLCRLRNKWEREQPSIAQTAEFKNFSNNLLQVVEHTWGMDEKTWLPGEKRAEGDELKTLLRSKAAKRFSSSWREKRALIWDAVAGLQTPTFETEADAILSESCPTPPVNTFSEFVPDDKIIETTHFQVSFNPTTGAITHLQQKSNNQLWFDAHHQFGLFSIDNYSRGDYDRFMTQYLRRTPEWAILDFSKPFLALNGQSNRAIPVAAKASQSALRNDFLFQLELPPLHGIPNNLILKYNFPSDRPVLAFEIQWQDKEPARMPHALWLSIAPRIITDGVWQMRKTGENISPLEVISRGGRTLHSIDDHVIYSAHDKTIKITSFDAPLMASGKPSLLDFTDSRPDMTGGVHFNLYNNIWGTNFPMWFSDGCRFKFELQF